MLGNIFTVLIADLKRHRNIVRRHSIIKGWQKSGMPVPPPHEVKQKAIEYYRAISGYDILVETGTFMGTMVEAQRRNFRRIYSIELAEKFWEAAVKRFKPYKHITILQGDSGKVLKKVVPELSGPAIFWLDGHYSGGDTAKGDKDCPIFEEIDILFENKKYNHIVLIDDARDFNGIGDYPTIEALTKYFTSKDPAYEVEVKDDVIRYVKKPF
jgi:hypothetical protein